jgi:hypothetical protein
MTIAIQNAAGQYVLPTSAATSAALNDATMEPTTNLVTFNANPSDAASYPIDVMSYLVVPTSGLSAAKATALASFIKFVLGATGQADVKSLGDAPVTTAMASAGMKVADQVAAEATQTSTTSTTSTTAAETTASNGSTGQGSTGQGSTGDGATAAAGSNPTLAFTGGLPLPIAVTGGGLLLLGGVFRRAIRRRMVSRGSGP